MMPRMIRELTRDLAMNERALYQSVEWSDEVQCFVGQCMNNVGAAMATRHSLHRGMIIALADGPSRTQFCKCSCLRLFSSVW